MAQPFHISGAAARPLFRNQPNIDLIRSIFNHAKKLMQSMGIEGIHGIKTLTQVFPHLLNFFWSLRHYGRLFFMSAVTIKAGDELYFSVLNWLTERKSRGRFTKDYTAKTPSDATPKGRNPPPRGLESEEASHMKFTPAFKNTWFFYSSNLFAVLLNDKNSNVDIPGFDHFGPVHMSIIRDSVTIACLGWSAAPIQALLKTCRETAETKRQTCVTIWSPRDTHWSVSAKKHLRPLNTVYVDDDVRKNLISDLKKYLDPRRRQFYGENGIPYRRGYLLHGPPGCGKSSLSLALAGFFGLDLYTMNLAGINEHQLVYLFAMLPARCFVLLEDIDAVGLRREGDTDGEEVENPNVGHSRGGCSLSGLLNVLDGIASQEGRVVIMTSNFPEKLDEALVRPGRIDLKIHMGYMTRQGIEKMFMRMMMTGRYDDLKKTDDSEKTDSSKKMDNAEKTEDPEKTKAEKCTVVAEDGQQVDEHHTDEELQDLAKTFSQHVPENTFTPAQLQGYLLGHLQSATTAVDKVAEWVVAEQRRMADDAKRKKREAKERTKAQANGKGAGSPVPNFYHAPSPEVMSDITLGSSELNRLFSTNSEGSEPRQVKGLLI